MPWKLKVPINTGDLDPVASYDKIRIVHMDHRSIQARMFINLEYGYEEVLNEGTPEEEIKWIGRIAPLGKELSIMIEKE